MGDNLGFRDNCEQNDQGDSGDSGNYSETANENYTVLDSHQLDFFKIHAISLQNNLTHQYLHQNTSSDCEIHKNLENIKSYQNSGSTRNNTSPSQLKRVKRGRNGHYVLPPISSMRVMSSNRDFRFTVEQIWLLQRLRNSGLSRDQIVAGLEDLDRLDGAAATPQTQFSSFSNHLAPKPVHQSYPSVNQISAARPQSNGSDNSKSPNEATEAEKISSSNTMSSATLPQTFPTSPGTAAQSALQKNLSAAAALLSKPMQPFSAMWAANRVSNSVNPYTALGSQFNNMSEDKEQLPYRRDEPDDLADEMDQIQRAVEHCERRNQHEVKEEIRIFTQRHHISQTAISKATHQAISQSYISQWLTSNITMGDAKRRIIYEWFCRQKRRLEGAYPGQPSSKGGSLPNPATLSSLQSRLINLQNVNTLNAATINVHQNGNDSLNSATTPTSQTQSPILSRKPRQRIMWPIKCLQFLDIAFGKNPYPGAAERGQLVMECNRLLGDDRSVDINECHVANWFRNRRKMKKVIDQSGPKSMEHFEDLIEMQEGSNESNEYEDRNTEISEIVDVEDNSRMENCDIKLEPGHGSHTNDIARSPLRLDEYKCVDSHMHTPDRVGSDQTSELSAPKPKYSAIVQNNSVLRSAIVSTTTSKNYQDDERSAIMQRVIASGPPQLTPAPNHLFTTSLIQANRSKIIQSMNMNGRMEA